MATGIRKTSRKRATDLRVVLSCTQREVGVEWPAKWPSTHSAEPLPPNFKQLFAKLNRCICRKRPIRPAREKAGSW